VLGNLVGNLHQIIQTSHWLAPLAAFLGGALTASNPCVLVMIPLMIGVTAGSQETRGIARSLVFSGLFVIGLSITFTILGIIAALGGRLFGDVGDYWKYIVALVALVMGVHLLGFFQFRFSIPMNTEFLKKGNLLSSPLLLGILFGVVSTPCAVPILALLLTYIAAKGSSLFYGGILLLLYALGHCVLVVVAGTSIGAAKAVIESKGGRKASSILKKVSGVLVILVGLYFLFL